VSKTYLVTGGTGFIGSGLVRRLIRAGNRVRVLDDDSRGSARRLRDLAGEIELTRGDVRDAAAVRRAVQGVDVVCHLASVNGTELFYSQPELVLDVAVKGIVNVIDACLATGAGELIVASSSEVYQTPPVVPTDENVPLTIPDPWNPRYSYAAGKLISEIMALTYGRKHLKRVVVFRPHNVFGPDMGWEHVVPQFVVRLHRLSQAQPTGRLRFPIQGSGEETRAFVYIDDFLDGLMLLVERGAHQAIYHVGNPEELAIGAVARMVGEQLGREIELVPGTPTPGGTARRCPDITKLAALGFAPKFSFREGLALTAPWYVEHADEAPERAAAGVAP
jgi:nucleoside-diphosphate-sugar epimerase